MTEFSKFQTTCSWIFQLLAAAILAKASYGKFSGDEMAIFIFDFLGIKGTIFIIATIEGAAALLLITKNFSHYGALLGFGTMMGALIAHATVLGIEVSNDGGMMVMLMVIVIISTSVVMWIRRRSLPLIGYTF